MNIIRNFHFTIFIILLAILMTHADDVQYTACSFKFACDSMLNIGYPFWGVNRPQFCGIPGLKLNCRDDNHTTMKIFDQGTTSFVRIIAINNVSHTIKFSPERMIKKCQSAGNLLSTLKPDNNTINLFYGCSTNCSSKYQLKSSICSNSDGTKGNVFYFDGPSSHVSKLAKSCSCLNNVSIPVDKRALYELRSTNASLISILTKSKNITMEYKANFTACSKCEETGGKCRSNADQFICYCSNGPQPLSCREGHRRKLTILASGVAALILGISMLVALIIRAKSRQTTSKLSFLWSRKSIEDQNVAAFLKSYGSLAPERYTYADIRKVTNSLKDKLGEGGYGSVYKGKLRNGRDVAVKKLKFSKGDGKDFINEVLTISRTNHINVITLLGFCYEGNKRALIFEYMPNGSLEKFMHSRETVRSVPCETVFKISVGIAKGLNYLHRGCNTRIVHFDIKPHNILLDEQFNPKISDFGLARLCSPKNSGISMSEAIRGTVGYIAPEVFCRNFGGVSHKSDVYSYGMMLLDLLCGRENTLGDTLQQNNSEMYFPDWIYNRLEHVEEGAIPGIEDDKNELERKMIMVSLWCIQTYPSNRPSMDRVVEMLEGPLESLVMPPKPNLSSPVKSVSVSSSMVST